MWAWLLSPIDPNSAHALSATVSWHARTMVLAWGVIAPLAVLIARFFKILPAQDWPNQLDSVFWWRSHWMGQSLVVILSIAGLILVLPGRLAEMNLHNWLGYGVLAGLTAQVLLGVFRGNKGGPTARGKDGDMRGHHYDMTPRRRMFELVHKSLGYVILILAAATILLGLWKVNGPVWIWITLIVWWLGLIVAFVILQRRGMAVDTYQAIWGPDPSHPGNRLPQPKWGVCRPGDGLEERENIRRP